VPAHDARPEVTAFQYSPAPYRARQPREAYNAVSQVAFRPDSAHLLIGREFASIRLRKGLVKRSCFFSTQLKQGLIFTGQLQEHASKLVLDFGGKATHRLDSLFK
jgi:hypothetical protein